MRRMTWGQVALVLLFVVPAHAEEPTPFRWPSREAIPRRISDAAALVNLGRDAWASIYQTDARTRWGFACRTGLTVAIAETTKRLVHRTRPNGLDRLSFFSEHTALATGAASSPVSASLALTVAWSRQASGMHFASDVAVGAGVGILARTVCP